ncbi:hypothetical protein PVAP13_3NG140903 [Panicum virgatum]|uniref:Uncharacterized protein n=1 Tax=Panicum virgatum TaxID=38727 RepID=A0A8T0U579_PANVG|nr:hypothetical protein PVAP13_3NG140903 [Panicum virgatum]
MTGKSGKKTVRKIDAVTVRHRTPATKRDYARTSRKLKKWGKKKRAIVTPTTLARHLILPPPERSSPQAGWGPRAVAVTFQLGAHGSAVFTNTTSAAQKRRHVTRFLPTR